MQSAITSLRHTSIHNDEARSALRVYGNEEDAIELRGYAYSGGGRAIEVRRGDLASSLTRASA